MDNKESGIRCLPTEGLVSLRDLSEHFGIRLDRMQAKLKSAGVRTTDLSRNARFRFISMSDLSKAGVVLKPYKKSKKGVAKPENKEAAMSLQQMKERISFETGNPDEDKRLRGELMNSDCFGKMYGTDDCCQNCTVLAELDGRTEQLKLFCEAISVSN